MGLAATDLATQQIEEAATGKPDTASTKACAHCGKSGAKKACGTYKEEAYCSRECQQARWPLHRPMCKQLLASRG